MTGFPIQFIDERKRRVDTLFKVIFFVAIQAAIWFLWPRYKGKPYMPPFIGVLIFSLLMLGGSILLVFDLPGAQSMIYGAGFIAFAAAILQLIKQKRQVSFRLFIKELFTCDAAHDYGFKGFVYLLMSGFLLFAITAISYGYSRLPFFVYLFGIPGIVAVVIGCGGMIYGFIRFYAPMILGWFKNDHK